MPVEIVAIPVVSKYAEPGKPFRATVQRLDTVKVTAKLIDEYRNVVNLTGCTVLITATDKAKTTLYNATIDDAVNGLIEFVVQPDVVGRYALTAKVTSGNNDETTFFLGAVTVAVEDKDVGSIDTMSSLTTEMLEAYTNVTNAQTGAAANAASAAASALSAEASKSLAKDWANKTGAAVNGSEYSAKYYAQLRETASTEAAASASAAAASASEASNSAAIANTKAAEASTSATNASSSEANAVASATTATTKATEANASAVSAANSATVANTSATNAAISETNANNSAAATSISATNAATSETNAATSETNAATSAANASNSAISASTSATMATAAANTATTKADEASVSATAANTSATNAAIYSNNASDKATSANNSALSASASAAQAALSTRIISRGVWVSSVSYSVGDFVSYNGVAYICIKATSGTTTPDADTADWVSMSTTVIYRKAGIDI